MTFPRKKDLSPTGWLLFRAVTRMGASAVAGYLSTRAEAVASAIWNNTAPAEWAEPLRELLEELERETWRGRG